jgi:hypothetical protein
MAAADAPTPGPRALSVDRRDCQDHRCAVMVGDTTWDVETGPRSVPGPGSATRLQHAVARFASVANDNVLPGAVVGLISRATT